MEQKETEKLLKMEEELKGQSHRSGRSGDRNFQSVCGVRAPI
jgi:hypothetical protein